MHAELVRHFTMIPVLVPVGTVPMRPLEKYIGFIFRRWDGGYSSSLPPAPLPRRPLLRPAPAQWSGLRGQQQRPQQERGGIVQTAMQAIF